MLHMRINIKSLCRSALLPSKFYEYTCARIDCSKSAVFIIIVHCLVHFYNFTNVSHNQNNIFLIFFKKMSTFIPTECDESKKSMSCNEVIAFRNVEIKIYNNEKHHTIIIIIISKKNCALFIRIY